MLSTLKILFTLPRPAKRVVSLFLDTLFIFIAYWGAWVVRIDKSSVFYQQVAWLLFAIVLPVTLLAFVRLGLYRAVLRYMGSKVAVAILLGLGISVFTLVTTAYCRLPAVRQSRLLSCPRQGQIKACARFSKIRKRLGG